MTFVLELQFGPAEEYRSILFTQGDGSSQELLCLYSNNFYELRAFCMYDGSIRFY